VVSLDSCFLIDLQGGEAGAVDAGAELDRSGVTKCITPTAAAEVLVGAYHLGGVYLQRARLLVDRLVLLSFDRAAYHEAARMGAVLLASGTPIGQGDLFVAAISRRHGEAVLTRDRVFSRIPGLEVVAY